MDVLAHHSTELVVLRIALMAIASMVAEQSDDPDRALADMEERALSTFDHMEIDFSGFEGDIAVAKSHMRASLFSGISLGG
ncbi:hypothetical protein [Mesorhizobium sp.]|uniref:hypothetical protein n=1 Tax=Mesorhizobium sp. TaxID=1871066 RepID=UPI000FE2D44D|nr:hypothetical protein [Mesorhizobium sp.]RWN46930.1 MAG: hypothetical protein EOR98_36395 [Mesorhizobium sp.]RWN68072.1 MAG: hypothetical protein EOS02_36195 [Mesorhizobium sp.]RWN75224.1 MAG: hypothetical protein EOS01_23460 [Mesorhizobium sp.]RWN77741.1 MAG: hypothetical protein EOS04_36395 [Mesorhizobium sp.]RWO10638.1 MAG: hypothetical protein EOS15_24265 [Mesorhizobium sp.]